MVKKIKIVKMFFVLIAAVISVSALMPNMVLAQAVIDPEYIEKLYIQTDRDVYFSGEEVLVKVSKFNGLSGTPGDFSRVGYVDMYNGFGNPMAQVKVDLEDFSGATGFRIPDTLSSGNYYVRAYTSWMKNFPAEGFAYKSIAVINPFEDVSSLFVKPAADSAGNPDTNLVDGIISEPLASILDTNSIPAPDKAIHIINSNPGIREKMEVRIDGFVTDDPMFSVTVVKSVLLDEIGKPEKPEYRHGSFIFDLSEAKYLPELNWNVISGVIRDKENNAPLPYTNIILSFIGRNARCSFSKTDSDGNFNFFIREKGALNLVIAPVSVAITDYYVELVDPFELSVPINNGSPVYIDTAKLEELNQAIIGMQVRNIYNPYLRHDSVVSEPFILNNFYGEPDNVVYLSEYIELTTVGEVVKEILPGAWTQKRSGQIRLNVVNKYPTGDFLDPPLVLFDGVPVRDIEKLINVPASDIDRIDIITSRYFISDITMEGIVHFISKKGDMGMMEYDKSIFRQIYNSVDNSGDKHNYPNYSTAVQKNGRIPDYRNTLYWDPFIDVNAAGEAVVEFYTADEEGDYTVIIEGFSSDGTYFKNSAGFTVTRR